MLNKPPLSTSQLKAAVKKHLQDKTHADAYDKMRGLSTVMDSVVQRYSHAATHAELMRACKVSRKEVFLGLAAFVETGWENFFRICAEAFKEKENKRVTALAAVPLGPVGSPFPPSVTNSPSRARLGKRGSSVVEALSAMSRAKRRSGGALLLPEPAVAIQIVLC